MRLTRYIIAISIICAALMPGCAVREDDPLRPVVVVSVPPQAFFVEQIAGDLVDIEIMIPPAANPATHEPTISQMKAVSRAKAYVKVGHPNFPFERAWLDHLLAENDGILVVDGSAGVDIELEDPHIWVSPGCVRTMAVNIHEALLEVLPEHNETLASNLVTFQDQIDAVDAEIRSALGKHAGGKFFVFHAAWGYLAEEYGLEQVVVEHGSIEPTPAAIAALIEEARASSVRVLFVQPQFSRESANLIAGEIGGEVLAIDPLDRDWLRNIVAVAETFRETFER